MIVLDTTTRKLQVVLSTAVATTQPQVLACWRDITTTGYTPGTTVIAANGVTAVDVVAAPAASTQRLVDYLCFYNKDNQAVEVTFQYNDNATIYVIAVITLRPAERFEYVEKTGVVVYGADGSRSSSITLDSPSDSPLTYVTLAADVTSNASADTMADITGLSFPVVSGRTYWFRFVIQYTSTVAANGSRWSINGPAATSMSYRSQYTLSSTSDTLNVGLAAYDLPAASNATSMTSTDGTKLPGNTAMVEGYITPSADGTVIGRFASELASANAIVAKAGSLLQWLQVDP